MLNYHQAVKKIISTAKTKIIHIPITKALNCTLAQSIYAKKDNPSFNNSLLDGYAAKSSDVQKNKLLKIIGSISAGSVKKISYKKNSCIQIATGCPIIEPFDCMIPYEQVEQQGNYISSKINIKKFDNVRKQGTDYKKNSLIISKGKIICAQDILTAKTLGITEVQVYEKPKVVLFCSGDEITENASNKNKIINGMSEYVQSYQHHYGFELIYLGIVKDNNKDLKKIYNQLSKVKGNTIFISTGGVSAGHKDFIPMMLKKNKYKILFHRILMQPGRPTLFATKANNYYFGLPGNPISGIVGFHFLIHPLLQHIQKKNAPLWKVATITHSYKKNKKLTQFVRAKLIDGKITILPGQESYKLSTLVKANCWIMLDQTKSLIKRGEQVKYLSYEN
jgi:molybdopterin molybdotransferase